MIGSAVYATRIAAFVAAGLIADAAHVSDAAQVAGDALKGKSAFQRCAICHRVEPNGGNGIGPNLFGIVGRKAGSIAGFNYSAAMKSSGITWSADKLDAYIEHPAATVPGNHMAFAGISDAGQRADVVAYLATLK